MTGKDISRWSDEFMYKAEKSTAADGPSAYLLGGPVDPLGQIVACISMYKGVVIRNLADVTDEERRDALEQIQKTVLTMPLEAVSLHFMIEGVHRGITHQMVRQRTAAFAQESTRFAVKEDLAEATALPPSLMDTVPWDVWEDRFKLQTQKQGLNLSESEIRDGALNAASKAQLHRIKWDEAVQSVSSAYNHLVNDGMAAEEARGLMPTNITTRLNYITNLRSFYETMSKRVGDQAQFEWRRLIAVMVNAMVRYGSEQKYRTWIFMDDQPGDVSLGWKDDEDGSGHRWQLVERSSGWQYQAIVEQIKPIEFTLGHRAFGANFDRPSRIGERVDAFAACGVPSSEWTKGSIEHNIPPIRPEEWLLDPDSARLTSDLEFDIWGQRVKKGTGFHWRKTISGGHVVSPDGDLFNFKDGALTEVVPV